MKKRLCALLLAIMCVGTLVGYTYGEKRVFDEADLLSAGEISQLEELLATTIEELQCDIAVLTTDDVGRKNSMEYAEDFCLEENLGYGSTEDAIVFLINMDDREVWITTSGRAINVLTDARISKLCDAAVEYLADGRYDKACTNFVKSVKNYFSSQVGSGDKYDDYYDDYYTDDFISIGDYDTGQTGGEILLKLGIALAIAVIAVLIMRHSAKAKMTVGASTYANNGYQMLGRQDVFIRTSVRKVRKSDNSRSGGGVRIGGGHSSVHRSGGRSFGGGGRRF